MLTWTPEEDKRLHNLVQQHGTKNWVLIASRMRTKTSKQCSRRWKNFLSMKTKTTIWTDSEDEQLIQYHRELGNRWTEISRRFGDRTDNAVKNRWHALCRKHPELAEEASPFTLVGVKRGTKIRADTANGRGPVPSPSPTTDAPSNVMQSSGEREDLETKRKRVKGAASKPDVGPFHHNGVGLENFVQDDRVGNAHMSVLASILQSSSHSQPPSMLPSEAPIQDHGALLVEHPHKHPLPTPFDLETPSAPAVPPPPPLPASIIYADKQSLSQRDIELAEQVNLSSIPINIHLTEKADASSSHPDKMISSLLPLSIDIGHVPRLNVGSGGGGQGGEHAARGIPELLNVNLSENVTKRMSKGLFGIPFPWLNLGRDPISVEVSQQDTGAASTSSPIVDNGQADGRQSGSVPQEGAPRALDTCKERDTMKRTSLSNLLSYLRSSMGLQGPNFSLQVTSAQQDWQPLKGEMHEDKEVEKKDLQMKGFVPVDRSTAGDPMLLSKSLEYWASQVISPHEVPEVNADGQDCVESGHMDMRKGSSSSSSIGILNMEHIEFLNRLLSSDTAEGVHYLYDQSLGTGFELAGVNKQEKVPTDLNARDNLDRNEEDSDAERKIESRPREKISLPKSQSAWHQVALPMQPAMQTPSAANTNDHMRLNEDERTQGLLHSGDNIKSQKIDRQDAGQKTTSSITEGREDIGNSTRRVRKRKAEDVSRLSC